MVQLGDVTVGEVPRSPVVLATDWSSDVVPKHELGYMA